MDSWYEIPTRLADSSTGLNEGKLPTSERFPNMASELPLSRPSLVTRTGCSRQWPVQSEGSVDSNRTGG